ncbi:ATP-binding protein [Actinomyces procaprae]|uniref:ATP-binding protein n=1 Tax=Actinomyces procaprae TaxID=2560010 RepID=UPI00109DE132|nr:ATP-binding protein [Actinomyces procaprae]
MIFIGGVHGVGKSHFCKRVKEVTGIEVYSASTLIASKKHAGFKGDKLISGIDDNQQYLLQAVSELRVSIRNFILDGHFCLLNDFGEVIRVSHDTFTTLRPDVIMLLTEKPEVIAARRMDRDGIEVSAHEIDAFQQEERAYAEEVADDLGVNLFVSTGTDNLAQAIEFIQSF